jgi:hypothetical protein
MIQKEKQTSLRDRHLPLRKQAEQKISRQVEELCIMNEDLTRFNKALVSREVRMIELKKEINELCAQISQQPHYPLGFEKGKE